MSVVLLVLNRNDDREVIRATLVAGGFVVHDVTGVSETATRASETQPTAIVVATDLPEAGCLRVCRRLRGDRTPTKVPLLLLAEGDHDPAIPEALRAGADDYVVRGCSPEALLSRLRLLIRTRQLALSAAINEPLAQVGRLLTGIVHEIRSPLTVVRGQVELLRMTLGDSEEHQRYLEPITRNVQLMQSRLDHLMAAVRGGAPSLEVVDIGALVREAADLFRKGSDPRRPSVAIEVDLADDLPGVSVDPGRLIQVLMNLLANGREAILGSETGQRGLIRLRTALAQDQDQSWVLIQVEDSGPGIPEDHLDRIFEPFFTTKAEGSGYGLYLSSEILREHGGRLTVCRSELGGAGFTIWIPNTDAPRALVEGLPPV